MLEQAVGDQRRQRAEHPAEGNVSAWFEAGGRALQHAHGGQHAFFGSRASHAHLGRRVGDAALRFVGSRGGRDVCSGRDVCGGRFVQTSLVDGFAERVVTDGQLLGDFASGATAAEQLLSLRGDFVGHHGGAACFANGVEAGGSFLAILLDASPDAVGGDAEGADDVDLSAGSLTDQLGTEHAKGPAVGLVVAKDGSDATEVGPLLVLLDDADAITDGSGPIGDER